MNNDQVRQDQIADARSRTLHASGNRDVRRSAPPRKVFVAKGHDSILKDIQDASGRVIITTMGDGTEHIGKLVARDKYTVTILTDGGSSKTFFKHAVESFEPIPVQVQ